MDGEPEGPKTSYTMRRSAAPSQIGNAAKRGRFVPPFRGSTSTISSTVKSSREEENDTSINISPVTTDDDNSLSGMSNSRRNVLALIQGQKNDDNSRSQNGIGITDSGLEEAENIEAHFGNAHVVPITESRQSTAKSDLSRSMDDNRSSNILQADENATSTSNSASGMTRAVPLSKRSFRAPLQGKQMPAALRSDAENEPEILAKYYSVMWCKRSKKKHKKWEGDAVMVTKGKSVSLLDMDGKEIGKSSGYKTSELESMEEGQSLFIGGKEIEVMGSISVEDFRAGKCFQVCSVVSNHVPQPRTVPAIPKAFANPQKSKDVDNIPKPSITKPLHDTSLPNALVLPRPSSSHQWQNNDGGATLVDICVDPYLANKLRPHQREGVRFLYECIMGLRGFSGNGAILADDMGLGKTLQCITLIWTLFQQGPYGGKPVLKRIIIVTPGSLVQNWCREFSKWLGKERIRVFGVASDKKIKEFVNSPIYPVMIVSYEMLVRYAEDIRKIKFDLMVCDEAHRLKNNTIKTTSILTSLSIKRRILLTGTPIQNDLQEFFSLADFCNPSILGTSSSFHRLYEEPVVRSRQPRATEEEKKIGETRAHELSRITSLFVLRRTQEINNQYLPPKVESVIFCKPTSLQLDMYRVLISSKMVRRCLSRFNTGDTTAPHLVCIGALKKLCNHPGLLYKSSREAAAEQDERRAATVDRYSYEDEGSLYDGLLPLFPAGYEAGDQPSTDSGKQTALADMLRALHSDGSQERIVLVSNYTQTLDLLQAFCEGEGYQFSRLDGSTPTSKRQQIVEGFNSKYARQTVFLLSSKAGGVGLNLIGASRLILYDIDWNPANDLQAMARVWRDGQRRKVHIYRLITAGTIEEKVYQRQISKQALSGAVVDQANKSDVTFSLEDLKDLFTLHDNASCLTHDMLDCDCLQSTRVPSIGENATNEPTLPRPCQLGRPDALTKTSKNLSMAQLLKWKHYKSPFQEDFEDGLLSTARESITFVFQNETNSQSGV